MQRRACGSVVMAQARTGTRAISATSRASDVRQCKNWPSPNLTPAASVATKLTARKMRIAAYNGVSATNCFFAAIPNAHRSRREISTRSTGRMSTGPA